MTTEYTEKGMKIQIWQVPGVPHFLAFFRVFRG